MDPVVFTDLVSLATRFVYVFSPNLLADRTSLTIIAKIERIPGNSGQSVATLVFLNRPVFWLEGILASLFFNDSRSQRT